MRSLLGCHSCLWPCLRAIAHRPLLAQPTALVRNRRLPRLVLSTSSRRGYAQEPSTYNYVPPKHYEENWHAYAKDEVANDIDEEALDDDADPDKVKRKPMRIKLEGAEKEFNYNGPVSETVRRNVKKELSWLSEDPKKVADHVLKQLKRGEEEKALMSVREMSSKMECVVAWNHIINHFMRKSFDKLALKVFNEMKKRGQRPDYFTYSLVLIGISNNMDKSQALTNAMAVYYAMSAPNSPKRPTILHTNLFLKVCAKAKAFDQLWAVASQIPDTGPGAADGATYSIILNALKDESERTMIDESTEDGQRRRDQAILDSRKIWADIVSKWRAHQLQMDEALVLAMARILLSGSRPRYHDELFSLVEQTMGIPRMTPRISSEPDPAQTRAIGAFNVPLNGTTNHNIAPGHEFDSVSPPRAVGGRQGEHYVKPSNITLTLLMEASLKTMSKQAADNYWSVLTTPETHGIEPDEPSIRGYLRVLRVFRSSADALQLVKTHFVHGNLRITPAIFRIAMSACTRDAKNQNSLDYATELLQLMERMLPGTDITTVGSYMSRVFDAEEGIDVLKGLERVEPTYRYIRDMLTYGKYNGSSMDEPKRQTAFDVLRRMVACYDRLINRVEAPRDKLSELSSRKAEISAFITRAFDKQMVRRGMDPELVKGRTREREQGRIGKQRLKQGVVRAEKPAFRGEPRPYQREDWKADPQKSRRQDIVDRKRSRAWKTEEEGGW
ncbi:uncharacterized protein J3D65DRAFT_563964 [Phyllosticta citribraziliensis]|uniref:Pentatricopeptide repeat protein n=1 Tax=Phyllosticta citribraziliensis TaxID=989973 RepID=A0ABR1MBG8_9PEZI